MELRLSMRQFTPIGKKIYPGQPIYYAGANPQSIQITQGYLPANRQWPNYLNFTDFTGDVSDLTKLSLSWSIQRNSDGEIAGGFQTKKGTSGVVSFTGQAYRLLRQWLVDDISAPLNSVDVQIEYVGCGKFVDYAITSKDITWCEDGLCQFDLYVKQQDENISCIKRTLIYDNWQGWFQIVPANGKKHPRFSYCNEARPNGTLVAEWYVITSLIGTTAMLFIALIPIINTIIAVTQAIVAILNAAGANLTAPNFISLSNFFDGVATIYVESSGCGREHPAPLIRDYITNVCDACGVTVDASTAPIFFESYSQFDTSQGAVSQPNPYFNACYLSPTVERGLRRFRRASILAGFQDPNDEYWISSNAPIHTLDTFLDEVCPAFNHQWRVENNKLYIQRKDFYLSNNYVYDFSTNAPDRAKIVNGVCYTPNGNKYPAYCHGIYIPDGSDSCGNEAGNNNGTGQMNGIVSFADADSNPNFEGLLDKSTKFGATRFRFDGVSGDYIYDAAQVVMNGGAFSASQIPGITFTVLQQVLERLDEYAAYALLLENETTSQPKILLWDGLRYENARAVIPYAAKQTTASQLLPPLTNPIYNPIGNTWAGLHKPKTDVIGRDLTLANTPNGIYRVTDFLGITIAQRPALLVNYPMFFEPNFTGTLWDLFHFIDDPRRNPKMGFDFSVKIRLCCEDLIKIGVLNNGSNIVLGQKIKLPFGFYKDGVIKEIEITFEVTGDYGAYIDLIGEL